MKTKSHFKRIFIIVTDSLGAGALPDSYKYSDTGTNTLLHLSESKDNFSIPNLQKLGIGNITKVHNVPYNLTPLASFAKAEEKSVGKDTLTGHWELMGLEVKQSFPAFTESGFPQELITKLEQETNHQFIGNIAASGTEIIKDLGEEHLATKKLIIYTSADSVLQIAANEEIIPLEELYRVCSIARKITLENPEWMVGRIIARPFIGKNKETFTRTSNRHDYAVKPFDKTALEVLKENGLDTIAIGKINDIFDGVGITKASKTKSNEDGMNQTIEICIKEDFTGLCFVNLVDFDALYGHRRNPQGYATCLEQFDVQLGKLLDVLKDDDLLIICADHGNDPTHTGTDHTREYIPILAYNKKITGKDLNTRKTFADVSATLLENFGFDPLLGTSFLNDLINPEPEILTTPYQLTVGDKTLIGFQTKKTLTPKKGIVLLVHGMAEHIERYQHFSEMLANDDYIVIGYNQRGHYGTENSSDDYGYMGEGNNFMRLVNDLNEIVDNIRFRYPNLPLNLFGHSMGSFVSQRFAQLFSNKISSLILCGTSKKSNLITSLESTVAKLITKTKGRKYRSKFLDNLSFGSFNKKFKPNKTPFDWLNSDEQEVEKYINDPHCGGIFSAAYFKDLLSGMNEINHNHDLIRKDLPILIISGEDDPVGEMGKGPQALYNHFNKIAINDSTLKLYKNARHEILLEKNKIEVENDIISWLNSKKNTF